MSSEIPQRLNAPVLFAISVTLGVIIGRKWLRPDDVDDYDWLYFMIVALAIMLASAIKDRYFEKGVDQTLRRIDRHVRHHQVAVTRLLESKLTPSIHSLASNGRVLSYAAEIIAQALTEPNPDARYILYVGSGALSRDARADDDDSKTPLNQYESRLAEARHEQLRVTRYIRLLPVNNYRNRTDSTRVHYRSWLRRQIEQLRGNHNYALFDCPRAPPWGSSRSSIISRRSILDVVGNGDSGLYIRGDDVAQAIEEGTVKLFKESRVRPENYDAERLLRYLNRLEKSDEASGPMDSE